MEWQRIEPPKKKADWRGKRMRLLEVPPPCKYDALDGGLVPQLPVMVGDVVKIYMRRAIKDLNWYLPEPHNAPFGLRVLEVEWFCPHCAHEHHLLVPESWIDEGKAEFVEEVNGND